MPNATEHNNLLDRLQGCLLGGAVGDALGYTIEFMPVRTIFSRYGAGGLQHYELHRTPHCARALALISDDTQMSLFTAEAILSFKELWKTQRAVPPAVLLLQGICAAYQDWLTTQTEDGPSADELNAVAEPWGLTKLKTLPSLYARRAPGNTCLQALQYWRRAPHLPENAQFIGLRLNDSKGCGGVMRTAPLALAFRKFGPEQPFRSLEDLDIAAAQAAAITHSHPLGYLPSATLNHLLSLILNRKPASPLSRAGLVALVEEAVQATGRLFAGAEQLSLLNSLIAQAVKLAHNSASDLDNIERLGQGWVAEETLAIAIYCALRHGDDFSAAVRTSVNHSGDSDSTGAVTGNIVGAILGAGAIDNSWLEPLEHRQLLQEIAKRLV